MRSAGWVGGRRQQGRSIVRDALRTWYGVLEMHTSKYGRSALTKSPMMSSNFRCSGLYTNQHHSLTTLPSLALTHLPNTRFVTSLAIRGSISTATTFRHCSNIRTVKFPVPGPTSRTTSVCFKFACDATKSGMSVTCRPYNRDNSPCPRFYASMPQNELSSHHPLQT
jgi:hypothetical protein